MAHKSAVLWSYYQNQILYKMEALPARVTRVASDVGHLQVERTPTVLSCIFPHCVHDFWKKDASIRDFQRRDSRDIFEKPSSLRCSASVLNRLFSLLIVFFWSIERLSDLTDIIQNDEHIMSEGKSNDDDTDGKKMFNSSSSLIINQFLAGGVSGLLSLSLIHIWRCRRSYACRSRWSPYH